MNKALYILEYQKDMEAGRWERSAKPDGAISVEADSYDEACTIAIKRLPKEIGKDRKYVPLSGYMDIVRLHAFRLKDCLDQSHASYIPSSQEINVENSSTSISTAYSRSSLL